MDEIWMIVVVGLRGVLRPRDGLYMWRVGRKTWFSLGHWWSILDTLQARGALGSSLVESFLENYVVSFHHSTDNCEATIAMQSIPRGCQRWYEALHSLPRIPRSTLSILQRK